MKIYICSRSEMIHLLKMNRNVVNTANIISISELGEGSLCESPIVEDRDNILKLYFSDVDYKIDWTTTPFDDDIFRFPVPSIFIEYISFSVGDVSQAI